MSKQGTYARVALMLLSCLCAAGCNRSSIVYREDGASYTKPQLGALMHRIETGDVGSRSSSKAVELRHDALVELRSRGVSESSAADLITRAFPATTRSVPVYVERADVAGAASVIIIEAFGKKGQDLSMKRLWVLDPETAGVLYSAVSVK